LVQTIRILYVITDLELGGVPLHLLRLVGAMRRRGFQTAVASLKSEGPVGRMLREQGVQVFACHGRGAWDFRVVGRLRRLIEGQRPDVLHTFLFHANLAGRSAACRAGFSAARVVCEIQTVEVERRWHLLVDRFTHRECRFTIGNSPSVIDHLALHARIPRERLWLVRGGIDPLPYANARALDRRTLGLRADERMVLWVGRLDPVKGLSPLVEAFALLGPKHAAHLFLAGEGPYRAKLEKRIARRGISAKVHLLGTRRDVPALLKAADVFVLPSRTEGLPNALLEAMAAARPIVTTDVPGCRDLIQHERTGLLVPYGDTHALAAALIHLLADRESAARLAAAAGKDVTDRWHLEQTHRSYAEIYEEIARDS